ncbi:sigma-70 family RNA polymerase sigma factor [Conexibacter sp. W3-3-2]|nr:sigma-70 family RNA polymerase sigma factor [Conexibacter sp. W3-3-2]
MCRGATGASELGEVERLAGAALGLVDVLCDAVEVVVVVGDPGEVVDAQEVQAACPVPNIAGEIRRHFRDKAPTIRLPRDIQERAALLQTETERLTVRLQRSPSVPELARACELTVEEILDVMAGERARAVGSLDAPVLQDTATLHELHGDRDGGYALAEHRATLDAALGVVGPREREILRLRFEEDLTQSQIAERVGLSQMHVSRLLRQTLETLRTTCDHPTPLPLTAS